MVQRTGSVSKDNFKGATLEDYAADILHIWPDDERRPVLYQWLSVVEHASCVAEEVRKTAWNRVVHEVAEVFVWWLSFVKCLAVRREETPEGKPDPDLLFYMPASAAEIIWWKFPNACPVCFGYALGEKEHIAVDATDLGGSEVSQESLREVYGQVEGQPCQCLSRKGRVEGRSNTFKQFTKRHLARVAGMNVKNMPKNLKGFEEMVGKLFEKSVIDTLKLEEIAFHFLEEVGEVSEALVKLHQQPQGSPDEFKTERVAKLMNLGEELADVFSWLVAVRAKTHQMLTSAVKYVEDTTSDDATKRFVRDVIEPSASLCGLVWQTYRHDEWLCCETCKERPCNRDADAHKGKSGFLFGDRVHDFADQILSVDLYGKVTWE